MHVNEVIIPQSMLSELNSILHKLTGKTITWLLEQLYKKNFKSNLDWNQVKLCMQHKYIYMYQKKFKIEEVSPNHFWTNLAQDHVLQYRDFGSIFE